MPAYVVNPFWGMGDNVWQLPYVRALARQHGRVYFATPWPQMYHAEQGCALIHPADYEPTHVTSGFYKWTYFKENIDAQPPGTYCRAASACGAVQITFGTGVLAGKTDLERICPPAVETALAYPADISFPCKPEWLSKAAEWLNNNAYTRPRVLLHVPTNRPGTVLARDPWFRYFARLYARYRDRVCFYDAARHVPGESEPIGDLDGLRVYPSRGPEITTLWALVALADIVVCSPNHMLPLALAFKRPTLALFGGCVWPDLLIDPRVRHAAYRAVAPAPYCGCGQMLHDCNKVLDEGQVYSAFEALLALPVKETAYAGG